MPLHKIIKAVSVQITIVSVNTSWGPYYGCFAGWEVSAVALAMEPVPRPASLEKIPRDTPFFILVNKVPTIPPVNAAG